jgi:hypothetical protein
LRPFLLDRCLLVVLPPFRVFRRQTEGALWAAFDAAAPRILGGLCDAAAAALRELPNVVIERPPRMADFACWVTAAEAALGWPTGAFLESYRANRAGANDVALEGSAIAPAGQAVAAASPAGEWRGTCTGLLAAMVARVGLAAGAVGRDPTREPEWPKNARRLSEQLRRIAPNLRANGVSVRFYDESEGRTKRRMVALQVQPEAPAGTGANAANAANAGFPGGSDGGWPRVEQPGVCPACGAEADWRYDGTGRRCCGRCGEVCRRSAA